MPAFDINYLGCGSATPTAHHLPSCQVIDFRGQLMMIDCGEGAQLQFKRMRLKLNRLTHIFISHLHGDHFLGLPGLLSTMALHDISGTITVHTFAEGADVLDRILRVFCRERPYTIEYDILEPGRATIVDDKALTIETFPLDHRVPAVGFLFKEKPGQRHIIGDMVRYHEVPVSRMNDIKNGADFVRPDGRVIPNAMLTTDPTPARSYAYCSDTAYKPDIAEWVRGVDTLYHEATYCDDCLAKAKTRGHSTASQAGLIATAAGARRLVLGHYSKVYRDINQFAREAANTFSGEIVAANEGLTLNL